MRIPPAPVIPSAVDSVDEPSDGQMVNPTEYPPVPALVACSVCASSTHPNANCPLSTPYGQGDDPTYNAEPPPDLAHPDATCEEPWLGESCQCCDSAQGVPANYPARSQGIVCYQCHQWGHRTLTCPLTRCYNCGAYGHSSQICYSKTHCFHCSDPGHRAAECPIKYKGRICYQCKEPGHQAANCPQGHLCKTCHLPGHIFTHCPEAICKYCREKGHTVGACTKLHCPQCGTTHPDGKCQNTQFVSDSSYIYEDAENKEMLATTPPTANEDVISNHQDNNHISPESTSVKVVPMYKPMYAMQNNKQVLVIIDGPYFDHCLRYHYIEPRTSDYYVHIVEILRCTLEYIGAIFDMNPIAYWFDIDPVVFEHFIEADLPPAKREATFKEIENRKRFLISEMNRDKLLPNVVPRLVGNMKRQRAYTEDGSNFVWAETGLSVAIAIHLIEASQNHKMCQQIVLLCEESDVYPAVNHCNIRQSISKEHQDCSPVRMCGISVSNPKIYGQQPNPSDFLPRILLDKSQHNENGIIYEFPAYKAFCGM
ncbi:unnamed protein product [Phytomonas sp. Hart1]|nr:unnamed protein product [Phytomonas sp. Hart1]|eukprot:CCW69302.1 unnamed protein product [Phytomonas sp. isolate Hart1]